MNYLLHKDKYISNLNLLNNYKKEIEEKKKEIDKKEDVVKNYLTALEIMYLLRTSKINNKRNKIVDMITLGCQDIFQKNYEIKILSNDELEEAGLKEIKYNIILYKNGIEVARNEKLLDSSGGGVLSVISVLIKIIINIIYSKEKFFIFDESMAQVSELYQNRLSSFIKNLCDKQDLTIVLITHIDNLSSHADYIYNFIGTFDKDDVALLSLKKEIKIDKYPYYELKLENFQSAKELELRFKGFTVIKGENDIGKSAVVRAISSVIYNDFKDNYVRFNKGRNEKCSITFSKVKSETENIFSMNLVKNSTGVFYEINGESFRGKQLAKDAIKEELEKNGFGSFIGSDGLSDLTTAKRNKISNLAITNQNDQLYLLDNSNSENNKIISYIFQATTINNGIIRTKETFKDIKKDNKVIQEELNRLTDFVSKKEVYVEYLRLIYFKELLKDLQSYTKNFNTMNNKLETIDYLAKKYGNLLHLKNLYINSIKQSFCINKSNIIKNDLLNIENKIEKTNNLMSSYKNIILLNKLKNKNLELDLIKNSFKIQENKFLLNKLHLNKNNVLLYSLKLSKLNHLNNDSKKITENINNLNINIIEKEQNFKKIGNLLKINKLLKNLKIEKDKSIILLKSFENSKNIIDNNNNKIIKLDKLHEDLIKYKTCFVKLKELNLKNIKKDEISQLLKEKEDLIKKNEIELNNLYEKHTCPKCNGKGYLI